MESPATKVEQPKAHNDDFLASDGVKSDSNNVVKMNRAPPKPQSDVGRSEWKNPRSGSGIAGKLRARDSGHSRTTITVKRLKSGSLSRVFSSVDAQIKIRLVVGLLRQGDGCIYPEQGHHLGKPRAAAKPPWQRMEVVIKRRKRRQHRKWRRLRRRSTDDMLHRILVPSFRWWVDVLTMAVIRIRLAEFLLIGEERKTERLNQVVELGSLAFMGSDRFNPVNQVVEPREIKMGNGENTLLHSFSFIPATEPSFYQDKRSSQRPVAAKEVEGLFLAAANPCHSLISEDSCRDALTDNQECIMFTWALECNDQWKNLHTLYQPALLSDKVIELQVKLRQTKVMDPMSFLHSKEGAVVNIGEVTFASIFNTLSSLLLPKGLVNFENNVRDRGLKQQVKRVMISTSAPDLGELFPIFKRLECQRLGVLYCARVDGSRSQRFVFRIRGSY